MKRIFIVLMLILLVAGVSFAAGPSDPSDLAEKCRNRCADSGKTGMDLRNCIKGCNKIENCGPDFQRCIKDAKTDAQREACQEGYRKCKGE
jgi:hypothetical protein